MQKCWERKSRVCPARRGEYLQVAYLFRLWIRNSTSKGHAKQRTLSAATAAVLTSNHHVRNEWYNTMKSVFVLFGNDDNVSLWIEFKRPYPLHPPPPLRIAVCLSVSVPLKIIRECVSIEMQRMRLKIHQMQTICTPRWTNLACISRGCRSQGTYCLCRDRNRDRRIRSRACWF